MERDGKVRLCFYLEEDVKREFHALCARRGLTMTEILRALVIQAIRDAARQQGGREEG